jgi:hypothetical protein
MSNVGLTVIPGIANGVSPAQEAPKRNIGMLSMRKRGPINNAILCTSLAEDRKRFGGIDGNYGAYVSRHIFNNAAPFGVSLYNIRLLGAGNAVASAQVILTSVVTAGLTKTTPASVGVAEVWTLAVGTPVIGVAYLVTIDTPIGPLQVVQTATTTVAATEAAAIAASFNAYLTAAGITTWTVAVSGNTVVFTRTVTNVPAYAPHMSVSVFGGSSVTFTSDCILSVKAGQLGLNDPGAWANFATGAPSATPVKVEVLPKNHVEGMAGRYVAKVYADGSLVETFSGSTWAELVAAANAGSYYVTLTLVTDSATFTVKQTLVLTGGLNGSAVTESLAYAVDSPTAPTGLAAFNSVEVQYVICPEFNTSTMAAQAKTWAVTKKNVQYFANMPLNPSDNDVAAFSAILQDTLSNPCSAYNFWVKTSNESGAFVFVPGIGIVIGAGVVRVPAANKDLIHTPPAGIDSAFRDCIDVTPNLSNDQQRINLYVQRYTMNVAKYTEGIGWYLVSSRTMSTNPLFHSIHAKAIEIFLIGTFDKSYQWLTQKAKTVDLRQQAIASLNAYGKTLYDQGTLEQTIPFEEAWAVISDSSNNPATQDRKMLNIDIRYVITEAVESAVINLQRNDGILITGAN